MSYHLQMSLLRIPVPQCPVRLPVSPRTPVAHVTSTDGLRLIVSPTYDSYLNQRSETAIGTPRGQGPPDVKPPACMLSYHLPSPSSPREVQTRPTVVGPPYGPLRLAGPAQKPHDPAPHHRPRGVVVIILS
ncbi:hypothetical protein CC85DRAFT_283354 [Cutaneotrichosporon oleaginosum]|uniref:Uncharacterized protein n=1 Tax=Cutaneotrichosporon oleaginosum TaxID=879819 RepID=A0A0J0XUF8_9TREE|nr:uncharacterized protein CC85DRAFT_283354 [Cutaneotrichosporon oleaginosum]KLT44718.1 hypothetical protein CC85DRAFT_283354 [Cutaneotrichosporon oleaginosum]TXT07703.1 hypothetical protein COLE_04627 [Cutaneotrichosporon oleaginosum]